MRGKQSPVLDRLTCLLYLLKPLRDPEDDESNVDQSDRPHPVKQQYKRKNYSTTKWRCIHQSSFFLDVLQFFVWGSVILNSLLEGKVSTESEHLKNNNIKQMNHANNVIAEKRMYNIPYFYTFRGRLFHGIRSWDWTSHPERRIIPCLSVIFVVGIVCVKGNSNPLYLV